MGVIKFDKWAVERIYYPINLLQLALVVRVATLAKQVPNRPNFQARPAGQLGVFRAEMATLALETSISRRVVVS